MNVFKWDALYAFNQGGRKTPFSYPYNVHDSLELLQIFAQNILTQTVRVPQLLNRAK